MHNKRPKIWCVSCVSQMEFSVLGRCCACVYGMNENPIQRQTIRESGSCVVYLLCSMRSRHMIVALNEFGLWWLRKGLEPISLNPVVMFTAAQMGLGESSYRLVNIHNKRKCLRSLYCHVIVCIYLLSDSIVG